MAEFQFYGAAFVSLANKEIDLTDGTVKVQLHTSSYTPAPDTHNYQDDLTNEVANGNGYTTGGYTLVTPTSNYIAAASATARADSTAYQLGDIVRPASNNDHVYLCVTAGTSAGTEPSMTTGRGDRITDNTVIWQEVGRGYYVFDAADPQWTGATFTCRYAVYYYNTGTPATAALIGYIDFGSDQSPVSGTFTILHDATGIFVLPVR